MTSILDPLNDGKSRLQLIDSMGNDLSIVNDARASFNKSSAQLTEKDIKLIHYLIQHKHFSPLRGVTFKFKVKAPLFICRQWWKHVIASNHNEEQLGWNEQSFRYVEIKDEEDFYIPSVFRQQSANNKQATEGEITNNAEAQKIFKLACHDSFYAYQQLLELGVGREQARGVLVPSFYTSWVWTASLQSVLNFIDLREGEGAQSEIAIYAAAIKDLITPIVPETIKAWNQSKTL